MFQLFKHEVKYYFRNFNEAIYIYSFIISILLLAPFGLPNVNPQLLITLAPVILWLALMTAITLGAMSLYQRDAEIGRLEYYQLLPISLEQVVVAKWAAFYLFVTLPLIAVVPLAGLLFHINPEYWLRYALGLGVGAMAMSAIASLASALMAGQERGGAILSLLVLPLTIPVMIFGSYYVQQSGALWQPSLMFLGAFTIFILPIMAMAGASCIRASH